MPNVIKATNLTVTKVFPKFFVAHDTFKKQDGSEGKQTYKIWWNKSHITENLVVDVVGTASANVNEFRDKENNLITYAQLSVNASEVKVSNPQQSWDTF